MLYIDWIRHTSLVVKPDLCYGHTDMAVAETFTEEAEVVKAELQKHHYDAVFTSPLSRAKKLCHYCGYGDVAIEDPRVMERNFGEWENSFWADLYEMLDTPEGSQYIGEHGQLFPPGGESEGDLLRRVREFIDDVRMEHYRRVAVFCHGGVINSARYFHGDIELKDLFVLVPGYGTITTLDYAHLDQQEVKQK